MRVLFCKIHCPSFICFCKPSAHIYAPGPLKLENSPHVVSSTLVSVTDASSGDHMCETIEVEEERVANKVEQATENCPKSSLRKSISEPKDVQKKRVQWMDFLGKELTEIREFEASEVEDTDTEGEYSRGCVCNIL